MRVRVIGMLIATVLTLGVSITEADPIGELGPTAPSRGSECVHQFVELSDPTDRGLRISANCSGRVFPHGRTFIFR